MFKKKEQPIIDIMRNDYDIAFTIVELLKGLDRKRYKKILEILQNREEFVMDFSKSVEQIHLK